MKWLGNEEFRQELLASMRERVGPHHYGMERHETGEQKAQQLVRSGLKQLHWTEADLETRPKGKVKLATTSQRESAERRREGILKTRPKPNESEKKPS